MGQLQFVQFNQAIKQYVFDVARLATDRREPKTIGANKSTDVANNVSTKPNRHLTKN